MKSVVFTGVGHAEAAQVADPELRSSGEVILKVSHAAICGSDLHPFRGEWGDPTGQRPGHEVIGEIVEVGADVRDRCLGEQVLASGAVGCGTCVPCTHSLAAACADGAQVLGIPMLSDYPGGQAEYVAVPSADATLLPIPDGMTPDQALLLTDNLATGWQAAVRAGIREGDAAVVVGFGPVGMCAAMSCRELGAWNVYVIDPLESRRSFAAKLGCQAYDATEDAVAEIRELTGGGASGVVETAGREAAVRSAFAVAHATATVSSISVPSEVYTTQPTEHVGPAQRYISTMCSPQRAWRELLPRLGSAAFEQLGEVFSHRMTLDDATAAYDLFANRPDECRKVQFEM